MKPTEFEMLTARTALDTFKHTPTAATYAACVKARSRVLGTRKAAIKVLNAKVKFARTFN